MPPTPGIQFIVRSLFLLRGLKICLKSLAGVLGTLGVLLDSFWLRLGSSCFLGALEAAGSLQEASRGEFGCQFGPNKKCLLESFSSSRMVRCLIQYFLLIVGTSSA